MFLEESQQQKIENTDVSWGKKRMAADVLGCVVYRSEMKYRQDNLFIGILLVEYMTAKIPKKCT